MKLPCADDGVVSEAGVFVEASYLIFKVRFDAPLLIDTVYVTVMGHREEPFARLPRHVAARRRMM